MRRVPAVAGAVAALVLLAGCASAGSAAVDQAPASEPLPTGAPEGDTGLRVAGRTTQLQLELAGDELKGPEFTVTEWVNAAAGPDVIQAFRAGALDVASNAIIPPIQAHDIGFDATIVSVLDTRYPSAHVALTL